VIVPGWKEIEKPKFLHKRSKWTQSDNSIELNGFPLLEPPCFGWAYLTQILIFINAVNCNRCAHIRAIIFILTSNLGDPTPEFQRPLSHYVFRHRLVYITYIFTSFNCTTPKNTLKPCTLNDEFQHFILRLIKNLNFPDVTERGD
jgi:hypothetical protein